MTSRKTSCISIIATVLLIIRHALALDILVIVSMPLGSHYMAFSSLFHELAIRGHNVTVLNNFPDKDPPPNLRFVDIGHRHTFNKSLESYEKSDSTFLHLTNAVRHLIGSVFLKEDCEHLLTSVHVKAHLAEDRKYDVIFVEQFMSDCGLAYALAFYDAPIIGITSHTLLPFTYPRVGLPFDIAADAFYFSNVGRNPSLLKKVENAIMQLVFTSVGQWYLHITIYNVFDQLAPDHSFDIERDARSRMKMVFSYQHFSVTGGRPLAPQLLEIGGIHVGVPKAVPEEVEKFLSDAKHGAIYVSFGSNLKASTMSAEKLQEFLTAFRRLPYKVIWKYENATFSQKNLYTGDWFPQLDILCHPKILAFVSHGGMLSLSESTHCGKPLVTVPFFGDQFSNAAALRDIGMGRTLYFDRLKADNLEAAIKELTTPEMQENAQRISRLWHDRPMSVMDSAIYWTEYVARHKSAPPSLPAKHNTWFEGLLIDVAFVIISVLLVIGFIVYSVFKFLKFIIVNFFSLSRRKKVKDE